MPQFFSFILYAPPQSIWKKKKKISTHPVSDKYSSIGSTAGENSDFQGCIILTSEKLTFFGKGLIES